MKKNLKISVYTLLLMPATSLGYASHAAIPLTITGNYTVNINDVCNGHCTVIPGATLTSKDKDIVSTKVVKQ